MLGDVVGLVEVLGDARVLDGRGVVLGGDAVGEVAVDDEEGDDVVGVFFDPADERLEFGLPGAGVEEVAAGVAVVDGVVDPVGLALYWPEVSSCSGGDKIEEDLRIRTPSFN